MQPPILDTCVKNLRTLTPPPHCFVLGKHLCRSCPPIKNFTAEAVQEELRINSQAFLEEGGGNLAVDLEKKTLWLTKIISWYRSDFGKKNKDVAATLLQWLRGADKEKLEALLAGGKFKIRHYTYDWSNVAKTSKTYGQ